MAYHQQQAPPAASQHGAPALKRPCDYPLEEKLWQLSGDDCCLCFQLETGIRILLALGIVFGSLSLILMMAGTGAAVGMDADKVPVFAMILGATLSFFDVVFSIFGWQASNDRIPQKALYYLWWRFASLLVAILQSLIMIGDGLGIVSLFLGGALRLYFLCATATWANRMIQERTGGRQQQQQQQPTYDMEGGQGPQYGFQPQQQQYQHQQSPQQFPPQHFQPQQQQQQQQFQQPQQQQFQQPQPQQQQPQQAAYPTIGQPQQQPQRQQEHQPRQQQAAASAAPYVTPGEAPPAAAASHGPTSTTPGTAGTYQPL